MQDKVVDKIPLYRITHRNNLRHILQYGICNKHHSQANPGFFPIGNPHVISSRDAHAVKIAGYGNIGEYIPFYFTPKSIMLYNITTGYGVNKVNQEEIIFLTSSIGALVSCNSRFFFTDGQANTRITNHFSTLDDLDKLDWQVIKSGDFAKSETDNDRTRRYQAEFLVHNHIPIDCILSIMVYNENCLNFVKDEMAQTAISLPVFTNQSFYFKH